MVMKREIAAILAGIYLMGLGMAPLCVGSTWFLTEKRLVTVLLWMSL